MFVNLATKHSTLLI